MMKTTAILLAGLLMAATAIAQGPTAPKAAKDDLKTRFPKVANAKWEVGRNGSEAEWKENGKEVVAVYDAKGKYLMTEREIDKASLPTAVSNGIQKSWPGATVREAEAQTHANKSVTYQVELTQAGVGREVTLDAQGKVIDDGSHGSGDDGSNEGSDGSDGSDEGNDGSDGSDNDD